MPRRTKPHGLAPEPQAKVTISLPRELLEAIDAFAAQEGRSRSNAAIRLLTLAIETTRRAG